MAMITTKRTRIIRSGFTVRTSFAGSRASGAALSVLLVLTASTACSSDEQQSQNPGSDSSTGPEASAPRTSAGNGGSPSTSDGDSTGAPSSGDSTGVSSSGDSTGSTATDSSEPAGAGDFSERGVCGQRGRSTVMAASFEGFEEFYIIGDRGLGEDVCVVRFDVTRTGDGQPGCADLDGQPCSWTHEVTLSNPTVELDMDGVCANSTVGLDESGIAGLVGSVASYGFVSEYAGHNSVLLKYMQASDSWVPFGNATWDEETGAFRFDNRTGQCLYEPAPN